MKVGLVNPYMSKSAGWWDDRLDALGSAFGLGMEDKEAQGQYSINLLRKLPLDIQRQIIQKVQNDPNSGLTYEDRVLDPQQWRLTNPGIREAFAMLANEANKAIFQYNQANPDNRINPNAEGGVTDYDNIINAQYGKHINTIIKNDPYLMGQYLKVQEMKHNADVTSKTLYGGVFADLVRNGIAEDRAGGILNALLSHDPTEQARVLGSLSQQDKAIVMRVARADILQDIKASQQASIILSGPMPLQGLERYQQGTLGKMMQNEVGGVIINPDNTVAIDDNNQVSIATPISSQAANAKYLTDTDQVITDQNGNVVTYSLNNEILGDPLLMYVAASYGDTSTSNNELSLADLVHDVNDNPDLQDAVLSLLELRQTSPEKYQQIFDLIQFRAQDLGVDPAQLLKPLIQQKKINLKPSSFIPKYKSQARQDIFRGDLDKSMQEQANVLQKYQGSLPKVYDRIDKNFLEKRTEDFRAPFVGGNTITYIDPKTGQPQQNSFFDNLMGRTSRANILEAAVRGRLTTGQALQDATTDNVVTRAAKRGSDAYFNESLPQFLKNNRLHNAMPDWYKNIVSEYVLPIGTDITDAAVEGMVNFSAGNTVNNVLGFGSSWDLNRNRSVGSPYEDTTKTILDHTPPVELGINAASELLPFGVGKAILAGGRAGGKAILAGGKTIFRGGRNGAKQIVKNTASNAPNAVVKSVSEGSIRRASRAKKKPTLTQELINENVPYIPFMGASALVNTNITTPRLMRSQLHTDQILTNNPVTKAVWSQFIPFRKYSLPAGNSVVTPAKSVPSNSAMYVAKNSQPATSLTGVPYNYSPSTVK